MHLVRERAPSREREDTRIGAVCVPDRAQAWYLPYCVSGCGELPAAPELVMLRHPFKRVCDVTMKIFTDTSCSSSVHVDELQLGVHTFLVLGVRAVGSVPNTNALATVLQLGAFVGAVFILPLSDAPFLVDDVAVPMPAAAATWGGFCRLLAMAQSCSARLDGVFTMDP